MKPPIKIIIADDHQLFVDGIKILINNEEGYELVGHAYDGKSLISILGKMTADVILMDINMPLMNGLESTKIIKSTNAQTKILMLSTYGEKYMIDRAKEYGADGYLLKTSSKEVLLKTIKEVHKGVSNYLEPQAAIRPIPLGYDDPFIKQFNLTKRELEIIDLIKKGLTNKEIADQLFLSQFTVKTHRRNITAKLDVNSTATLLKFINDYNL